MNTSEPPPLPPAPPKINWFIFFAVLLAPLAISAVAGTLDAKNGGVAPVIALLGGGISGVVCGVMLGRRIGKSPSRRLGLGFVLVLVMSAVGVLMSFFGCMAGGYQLDMR